MEKIGNDFIDHFYYRILNELENVYLEECKNVLDIYGERPENLCSIVDLRFEGLHYVKLEFNTGYKLSEYIINDVKRIYKETVELFNQ